MHEKSLLARGIVALTIAGAAAFAACKPAAPAGPRVVTIKTGDSVTLQGTLFAASKGGPGVLLLHQCDDHRTVWDSLGTRLAAAGITALSVDYRGYGESGGTPHEKLSNADLAKQMAETWPADIDSAFAFLLREPGVRAERVGAAGGSCGVGNAVQLARRHANVVALALLAGPIDRDGRLFLANPGAPPVFAAAAADDQYANFVQIMAWTFGVSRSPYSRLAQYPTGGHAAIVFRTRPGLADTITKWFSAVLPATAGDVPKTNGVPLDSRVLESLADVDQPGAAGALLKGGPAAIAGLPKLPEYFVNQLGYEHMLMKDFGGAIDLMKLNAALYPASPNTMDSVGDVYLAAGDTARTIDAAKRTLVLLQADTVDTPDRKQALKGAADAKIKTLSPTHSGGERRE